MSGLCGIHKDWHGDCETCQIGLPPSIGPREGRGLVSQLGDAIEILDQDRQEWKRRALLAESALATLTREAVELRSRLETMRSHRPDLYCALFDVKETEAKP